MRYTEEDKELAREMVKQGKSLNEIARHFGCSYENVRLWVKGVSRPAKTVRTVRTEKKEPEDKLIVKPVWVNNKIIEIGPVVVRRHRFGDDRFYYTFDEFGAPTFYIGVTSALDHVGRNAVSLQVWRDKTPNWREIMEDRADYGTVMHILFGEMILGGQTLDEEMLFDKILIEATKLNRDDRWVRTNFDDWRKDLLALAQWIVDYMVEPLAIELPLVDDFYRVGGCLDFPCYIWEDVEGYHGEVYKTPNKEKGIKKGDPKLSKKKQQFMAIVDFKSGRKGFYEGHEEQLALYKHLFMRNYPEVSEVRLYNWSPKEWRTEPGYNFTEQTNKISDEVLTWMLEGIRLKWKYGEIKMSRHFKTFGNLEPGQRPADNFRLLTAEQYVIEKFNNK